MAGPETTSRRRHQFGLMQLVVAMSAFAMAAAIWRFLYVPRSDAVGLELIAPVCGAITCLSAGLGILADRIKTSIVLGILVGLAIGVGVRFLWNA